MRRHWLLFLVWVFPTVALARSPVVHEAPPFALAIRPGINAGIVELTFHQAVATPDAVIVELSNEALRWTYTVAPDRGRAAGERMTIDLEALTEDLPRGSYDALVTWQSRDVVYRATAPARLPYRCGLYDASQAAAPRSPRPSSKLPIAACAIIGLLVALRLAKRAGTADARVPCCLP